VTPLLSTATLGAGALALGLALALAVEVGAGVASGFGSLLQETSPAQASATPSHAGTKEWEIDGAGTSRKLHNAGGRETGWRSE